MAGKRAVERYVPVTGLEDATHVEVNTFYDSGGMSYFTYKNEPRGYWAAVKPVTVEAPNARYPGSFGSVAFMMLDSRGFKLFLKPAARYSEKTLRELAAKVDAVAEKAAAAIAAGDKDGAAAVLLPLRAEAA